MHSSLSSPSPYVRPPNRSTRTGLVSMQSALRGPTPVATRALPAALLLTLLSVGCGLLGPTSPTYYLVRPDRSGDAPTIQSAINRADSGDTIELTDGVFRGYGNRDLDLGGKELLIRSSSGEPDSCVIECGGTEDLPHRGFTLSGVGRDCVIQDITIEGGHTEYSGSGGGIWVVSGSPTIRGCVFEGNWAGLGGGLQVASGSPVIDDCTFRANVAYGGSAAGGGAECSDESNTVFVDCSFLENHSYGLGGGARVGGSSELAGCTFAGNWGAQGGGASCRSGSSPVFVECLFEGNSAYAAAGVKCGDASTPSFTGCAFVRNECDGYAGGISCGSESAVLLSGCTVSANVGLYQVAGIGCRTGADLRIENTIVAFNGPTVGVRVEDGASVTVICADIYGNDGGDWVGVLADQLGFSGNISDDPEFCDADAQDFTLNAASPCNPENSGCGLIGAYPVGCGDRE